MSSLYTEAMKNTNSVTPPTTSTDAISTASGGGDGMSATGSQIEPTNAMRNTGGRSGLSTTNPAGPTDTVRNASGSVGPGPVITSPTDAINATSVAASAPPTTTPIAAPYAATSPNFGVPADTATPPPNAPNCCTAPGTKCDKESCSGGNGACNQENCKCDASCQCKSNNEESSESGKPENCQSPNPTDCADESCKLGRPDDPRRASLVTNGKCLGPALYEGPEDVPCPEGDKKEDCQKKRRVSDRQRCPLSGDCDDPNDDSSLVLWNPSQGSPEGSPRSEQKLVGETRGPKEGLKLCSHPEDNIHRQEEHYKLCSPLPQGDKLKAILFDIDGTIADSDPIHFLAFQEILAEAGYNGGVPISHEFFIRQMSGKLNYVIAEELMPELDEQKRIEMMDEKEARYRQKAAQDLQPIPGFHKFSEYVKSRGLRRAAVTNSPRLNAEQVIAALKIPDFFEIVVVGSECDNPKPSPDPYLTAIKFLGVESNQCFVFEDSPSGIKAGRAAGSPVVGLLTGHPGPVLRDNGASVLIRDYQDSALWIALGEDESVWPPISQSQDSTPSTGVPPPVALPA